MRLVDVKCARCNYIKYDVWDDEVPRACVTCGGAMTLVLTRPPAVDARDPFRNPSLGGGEFSSHHEEKQYATLTGQELITPKEAATRRHQTTEERLARNDSAKREAVSKSLYRLRHGYKDFPSLPKETP